MNQQGNSDAYGKDDGGNENNAKRLRLTTTMEMPTLTRVPIVGLSREDYNLLASNPNERADFSNPDPYNVYYLMAKATENPHRTIVSGFVFLLHGSDSEDAFLEYVASRSTQWVDFTQTTLWHPFRFQTVDRDASHEGHITYITSAAEHHTFVMFPGSQFVIRYSEPDGPTVPTLEIIGPKRYMKEQENSQKQNTMEQEESLFDNLSAELHYSIIEFLSPKDCMQLGRCNKTAAGYVVHHASMQSMKHFKVDGTGGSVNELEDILRPVEAAKEAHLATGYFEDGVFDSDAHSAACQTIQDLANQAKLYAIDKIVMCCCHLKTMKTFLQRGSPVCTFTRMLLYRMAGYLSQVGIEFTHENLFVAWHRIWILDNGRHRLEQPEVE